MRNATKLIFLLALSSSLYGLDREEYTRNFDKSFTLHAGQSVRVEHRMGEIVIHTHPQMELIIHAEIRVSASDQSRAREFADKIEILAEPYQSEYSIRTHYPENPSSFFGFNRVSYSVRYEITMPESAPLNIRNEFGAVSVTGLKANGDIKSSHGAISFQDAAGTQHIEDSFASVEVSHNSGDVVIANTNGSVKVADIAGALTVTDRFASVSAEHIAKNVKISNTNGTVEVSDCGSFATIGNAFASVTVHNLGGDLTVHNGNGKVEAINIKGAADLNTSFAEVSFSNIGRGLSIRTNNSHVEGSNVKGSAKIENSFGATAISNVDGGVHIQSANGAVSATDIRGDANVKTSFAGVELQQVAGAIDVDNQNGSVNATSDAGSNSQNVCRPISIHTSFAPIRIHLAGSPNYRVTAKTSFGKVRSDIPLMVSGSLSDDALSGTIGAGLCELRLTDNNGTIEILKASSSH
jgi:hypothetical protein